MTVLEISSFGPARSASEFARDIFASLPRSDQRRWAEVYLRGLLTVRGKKTIRGIIDGVLGSESSTAAQSLQQFISQSTWDWYPVRELLARNAHLGFDAQAWVVQRAIVPKRGKSSVGVARRFVNSMGRTVNCQLGIGLFLTSDSASVPVDWSLALDEGWSRDEWRRTRAKIPDDAVGKTGSAHVLSMVDRALGDWGLPSAPLLAQTCGDPEALELLAGLTARGMDFLVEVPATLEVVEPTTAQHGPAPLVRGGALPQGRPVAAGEAAGGRTSRPHLATLTRPGGEQQRVYLRSSLVRVPGLRLPGAVQPPLYRLYSQWSPQGGRPTRLWLTNLLHHRPDEVMNLSALGRRSATDLREMEEDFGVKDFEGRSYPGWHRHMTLVSAAYGFHRLVRPPGL